MVPPPATPSPHRFVAPRPAKPPSSLRKQFAPRPSSSQFAPTPKFSLRSNNSIEDVPAEVGTSPLVGRERRPLGYKLKRGEEIEDEGDFGGEKDVEAVEEDIAAPIDEATDDKINSKPQSHLHPRPLKRRRSSPPTTTKASTSTILISDDEDASSTTSETDSTHSGPNDENPSSPRFTTPHPPSHTAPRFTFHPPPPTRPLTPPRPAFILPTPTATDPTYPLPEAFSPHRRGAKYVPGGLAATCREWILGVESTLPSHTRASTLSRSTGLAREEEWSTRVRVEEYRDGGGMVLVRGRGVGVEGGEERWVLVGGKGGVRGGDVVEVGRPVWEVEVGVGREVWGVGVEWRVL